MNTVVDKSAKRVPKHNLLEKLTDFPELFFGALIQLNLFLRFTLFVDYYEETLDATFGKDGTRYLNSYLSDVRGLQGKTLFTKLSLVTGMSIVTGDRPRKATKSGTHDDLSWRWQRSVDDSEAVTSTLNDGKFQPISFWMRPTRIILVSCQLAVSLVSFNERYLILVIRAVRRHVFCGRRRESGVERRATKTSDDIKQLLLSSK